MNLKDLFEKWDLHSHFEQWKDFKPKTAILEMPLCPSEADKDGIWELYSELLIFITQTGDENMAIWDAKDLIDRTNALCVKTGKILRKHGRSCLHFSRIAGIFLNYIIRPFLGAYNAPGEEDSYFNSIYEDFDEMYEKLVKYEKLLADILGVEDIIEIEKRCRIFG